MPACESGNHDIYRTGKTMGKSTVRRPTTGPGTSWRAFWVILALILSTGCASRGEGLTINSSGLHVGTSLVVRDQIARDKGNAEIAQILARTKLEIDKGIASIAQSVAMSKVTRPVVLVVGIALALGVAAVGLGFGAQRAEPAIKATLEVRKTRRLEMIVEIGPGGYSAKLLTIGYDPKEIAVIVQATPALNAPRLAELQMRIGDRGMRALADHGQLEDTLTLLEVKDE